MYVCMCICVYVKKDVRILHYNRQHHTYIHTVHTKTSGSTAAKTDLAVLVSDTLLLLVMSVARGGTTGSLNSGQGYIHSSTRVLATQGQYKLYGTRQCTTTTTTTTQSDIIAGPFRIYTYTYNKHTHTLSIKFTSSNHNSD